MKKILLTLLLFWINTAFAAVNAPLAANIERLMQTHIPEANSGVLFLDAESGDILYEKNADRYFLPGSTLKLLPAIASLLTFGKDHRFETTASIQKNDLYLTFSGDPSFSSADLNQLIAHIKSQGISHIAGDIIIDSSRYETPDYAMGWTVDALAWYYAAPVSAIILNENKVKLILQSNPMLGEKTTISLAPAEPNKITIHNQTVSVSPLDAETECQFQTHITDDNVLTLKGCFPYHEKPRILQMAIKNPFLLLKQNLLSALKEQGLKLQGNIKEAKKPLNSTLTPIAVHYSAPLDELLRPVLTDSNNLYADSLTKALGFAYFKQGSLQSGTRAIQAVLKEKTGLNLDETKVFDGSGLSRYNLITPKQLAAILQAVWKNPELKQPFREALAVAGKTGTLSTRFKELEENSIIRAKTGMLSGVSALAGYLESPNHKPVIFVIVTNNFTQPLSNIRQFEEKLCGLFKQNDSIALK